MPVALLLQNMLRMLRSAVTGLTPWLAIVPAEETIVERARSAFLVHWFGPRLPFDGLSLRAYIVNTDELARQYHLANQSVPSSPGGPNLTEPIAGVAGLVAGVMLSPMGAIAGVYAYLSVAGFSIQTILVALAWLAAPSLLILGMSLVPAGTSVFFSGLVAGGVGGYMLAAGLGDRREFRALFNLFGSLARFMNAAVVFLDQLLGDRSRIQNPLLRQILEVADRLAPFVAGALGAVAVVVRRIGPVLVPLAETIVALGGLVGAGFTAIADILGGLADRFDQLASGDLSITAVIDRVVATANAQVELVQGALTDEMETIATTLAGIGPALTSAFGEFATAAGDFIKRLFTEHWTGRVIEALKTQVGVITTAWAAVPSPPGALAPMFASLPTLPPVPTLPPFPAIPTEAERERIAQQLGVGGVPDLSLEHIEAVASELGRQRDPATHLELSEAAQTRLQRTLRRPSVFAPERAALMAELGRTPAEALELNRAQLMRLRDALAVVVGRILPPEFRVYAPVLAEKLRAIDRAIYGVETPAPTELPVLDLPTTDELRPHVRILRLRMPGAHINDVRAFQEVLLGRLRAQSYATSLPAGAP